MKTFDKEQCKIIAKGIFKKYPNAKKVAVTSDGQPFIIDDTDVAVKNHSVNNRYKKELKIENFLRDEVVEERMENSEAKVYDKNTQQMTAEIRAAKTKEDVLALAEGDERVTVKKEAEKKLEALRVEELIQKIESAETEEAVNNLINGESNPIVLEAAKTKFETFKTSEQ